MTAREGIPAENLKIWRQVAAENRELRLLQIEQMAKTLGDTLQQGEEFSTDTLSIFATGTDGFSLAMAVDEQLAFCRALLSKRPDIAKSGEITYPAAPAAPRMARLKGSIFSAAFNRFSPLLSGARPLYVSSLSDLLEATASGDADFAILPIEDSKGGRFLHFYEELDRLDLHMTHTCDVPSEESGRTVRFALISKLYQPTGFLPCHPFFDCRLYVDAPKNLTAFLAAAEGADATLYRLDSLPAPDAEGSFTYYPIFSAADGGILLEAYINIFMPRAAVVERYLHLKGENI
ncbi:MAG: hypothetical protein IJX39_01065 [Clostridia bacterium]|nr:hypothetical protein [Clostridia bacterium]